MDGGGVHWPEVAEEAFSAQLSISVKGTEEICRLLFKRKHIYLTVWAS